MLTLHLPWPAVQSLNLLLSMQHTQQLLRCSSQHAALSDHDHTSQGSTTYSDLQSQQIANFVFIEYLPSLGCDSTSCDSSYILACTDVCGAQTVHKAIHQTNAQQCSKLSVTCSGAEALLRPERSFPGV